MIYICCLDAVDATVYAGRVLGIRLRQQQSEARLITKLAQVPVRCESLDIRSTPEFWEALMEPAEEVAPNNHLIDVRARRNVAAREAGNIAKARAIASAVRLRGSVVKPPYDVPAALDEQSIEEWLDRRD